MSNKSNDLKFIKKAYEIGKRYGTDPSTQNGAIIVNEDTGEIISYGANYFPNNVIDLPERWERPIKYSYVEHAERNAIYQAVFNGESVRGLTMYCYWAACADCARAIIQSGIRRLVTHKIIMDATPDHWKASIEVAFQMMREAGVQLDQVEDPIDDIQIRFNGKLWTPNGVNQ